ncbi:hypothetical protein F5B19DRAFT_462243 [Rostrohypoxylon terebratum]|nr:hypothetical protein F5B19DRAFT_462243 [Rostrohypoxylon terebratum]
MGRYAPFSSLLFCTTFLSARSVDFSISDGKPPRPGKPRFGTMHDEGCLQSSYYHLHSCAIRQHQRSAKLRHRQLCRWHYYIGPIFEPTPAQCPSEDRALVGLYSLHIECLYLFVILAEQRRKAKSKRETGSETSQLAASIVQSASP